MKCRKNTETNNLEVGKTKNGRRKLLSKWAVYNSTKSKFIKKLEDYFTGIKIQIISDLTIINTLL